MNFSEYREARDSIEFDRKFSLLCENIARSDRGFDNWWSSEGLPIILESYKYDNEEELLMELFGTGGNPGGVTRALGRGVGNIGRGIAGAWDSVKQHGQAFGQSANDAYGGQQTQGTWNPQTGQWEQPQQQPPVDPNTAAPLVDPNAAPVDPNAPAPDPGTAGADPNAAAAPAAGGPEAAAQQEAPAMSPEKQQRLDAFQRGIDQSTDKIKKRFSGAMKDFLQAVQGDAKTDNDAHMWQIAKNFNQQVMQAAQPAIDGFKQQAKYGQQQAGGYQDKFSQARGAMQNDQQANMKQKLQAKHGGGQQTAGAQQSLQPQSPDMKTPIQDLAKQQFPGGAHMRPGMAVR